MVPGQNHDYGIVTRKKISRTERNAATKKIFKTEKLWHPTSSETDVVAVDRLKAWRIQRTAGIKRGLRIAQEGNTTAGTGYKDHRR